MANFRPLYHFPGDYSPDWDRLPDLNRIPIQAAQCRYDGEDCQLDLWTDTDPNNIQQNNDHYSINNDNDIISGINQKFIARFTLPFFYWKSASPELVNKDYEQRNLPKPPPDIAGRIVVQLFHQNDGVTNWTAIAQRVNELMQFLNERESRSDWFLKIVVPFSTRTLGSTCKSFFPLTCTLHRNLSHPELRNVTRMVDYLPSPFTRLAALIGDVATSPLKLSSLIPRAVYQHKVQKNRDIEGLRDIQITIGKGRRNGFSWNQGVFCIDLPTIVNYQHYNLIEFVRKQHKVFILGS